MCPARPARPIPELLAPAGSRDSLVAAVANGADAVYLGLGELNARRGADNFDLESLAEATRHAHLHGVRVYLTANIVVLQQEMEVALRMVADAWNAGVDAVIVQDLGLLAMLRRHLPDVRVHASTQIDAHNTETVRALATMGASRVTLARETSVEEIATLARDGGVEVESFVHGSLCFCYSGQCLMSSVIGARSANRGLCAQPCRLAYDLVDTDGTVATVPGRYLLSPKDLAGLDLLPALVASGVSALKIEGRMKSPEYVATVVAVYRAALDRAIADPQSYQAGRAEWDMLEEAFSRGFSEGYLSGIRDDRMMSYSRPNNRGVLVGRVASTGSGAATIALDRAVETGDRIEVWTGGGRFAQVAGALDVEGRHVPVAPAGSRATIALEHPVRTGDRVFRVASASLTDAARRTFVVGRDHRPTPVEFAVRLRVGTPVGITATAEGLRATAEGGMVEPARTRPVTAEDVIDHVGRLGGSTYVASGWDIELDPDAGIGFSSLHALRRQALERLDALRLEPWTSRPHVSPPTGLGEPPSARGRSRSSRDASSGSDSARATASPALVVAVADRRVAAACVAAGADRVLCTVQAGDSAAALPAGVTPLLPRIAHDPEIDALMAAVTPGEHVATGNLGLLAAAARSGATVEADTGLNAVSAWTVAALADAGASFVWASPEVSGRQLAAMADASPVPLGVVVHGRLELMVAEHCVLQAAGECSHRCEGCARRRQAWVLRDAKGYAFPVTSDSCGRAHVYNSVPLDLSRALPEIVDAGVAAVRLELFTSSPDEAAALVKAYRRLLADAAAGRAAETSLVSPSTSGHFYRGVR
jgi:putative protease